MRIQRSVTRGAARLGLVAVLAAVTAPVADAQIIPAAQQNRPVALTNARIHTVTNGVIENGTIIFEHGVITAVGAGIDIPAGTRIVDVPGKHVYPGLIGA